MTLKSSLLLCALCLPSLASAQVAFSGAELSVSHNVSNEDFLGLTSYSGGVELSPLNGVNVGADFTLHGFGPLDTDASNFTLHANYDTGMGFVGGVFVSRESTDAFDSTTLGFEGAALLSFGRVEGFLGFSENALEDITLFGLKGGYTLSDTLILTADYARATGDEDSFSRVAFGADYGFLAGPVLFGEVGYVSSDNSGVYLGLGARVALGPNAGTSFHSRGLLSTLGSY